jgi:hypothetical protein
MSNLSLRLRGNHKNKDAQKQDKAKELYKKPLIYIFLSAAVFGISTPFAKLLVKNIPSVALDGLPRTQAPRSVSRPFPLAGHPSPARTLAAAICNHNVKHRGQITGAPHGALGGNSVRNAHHFHQKIERAKSL